MMELLTNEQVVFARNCMSKWLRIRATWDRKSFIATIIPAQEQDQLFTEVARELFDQLAADVDHSSLLLRLLSGKEPLREPPPLKFSYPVYPDDELDKKLDDLDLDVTGDDAFGV